MLEYLLEYKTLLQVAVTERRLMSVLEKIIEAERAASALLLKAQEEAALIHARAQDELVSLKTKSAQELAKEINGIVKVANEEITKISETFVAKKEVISAEIEKSAKTKKAKMTNAIFKDITAL